MKTILKLSFLLFTTLCLAQKNIVSEDIMLKNDSIILPGTLSYNKALKQQPLVIFIHGSGNIDRNGNQALQAQANYIKQLSEALNKNDIAFYRYDKRTATMSNLQIAMKAPSKELTLDKFVEDTKIAIKNFKNDPRFPSITLIGHSQGSLVAMLASKIGIEKYISLAGPSEPIDITITKQIRLRRGDSLADITKNHFKELKETGTVAKVNPDLMAIFNKPTQPLIKTWAAYTPTEELKKVTVPTLILNGTKDLQVFKEDAKNLQKAKPNAKLVMIENMNHVLKTITIDDDNLKSYTSPDFPLSKQLITVITEFVKQ